MTWHGAQLLRSSDGGSSYEGVVSTTVSATIGTVAGVLGDFTGGNIFDRVNSFSVVLQSGNPLLSYTELQVLNGSGLFVIGAPGRWEVGRYKTATLTAANTYTVSVMLRGRRGTEWAIPLHAAGDKFILVEAAAFQRPNQGTGLIGLERLYKGVTFRASLASATAQSFTNNAQGLMPYAPCRLTGTRDGSNNLTINWMRRTRRGGAWRDFVDVPIGEDSLAFIVEVWNSTYTTLLRTITGITSETTTYTAAEQTADGLTPGNTVYLKVMQVSATVGPGYALIGSV
jgi:hypothetical protein